ncbi:hypothetical protein SO802_033305 [Lithocarpus litseifolius]|uniref:Uncharacterized protein n=1 Tax=Lithocarpus litseifolius TaxID=425828 RepID=A0AAW2BCN6_9ROSI
MGELDCESIQANEADRIQFALNLELLKVEFFLNGAAGQGLNTNNPSLAERGPPCIGTKKQGSRYRTDTSRYVLYRRTDHTGQF